MILWIRYLRQYTLSLAPLVAVGIAPGLDILLKKVILGAVVIVAAVINAMIAIPIGVIIAWLYLKSWKTRNRIVAGISISVSAFLCLLLGELLVVAFIAGK